MYYGRQPLEIFDFPLWWAFINTAVAIVGGVALCLLRPWLTGTRALIVVALVPMIDGAVNAAAGWPVWSALNTRLPAAPIQLAGLATCGLCVLLVWVVTRPLDSPLLFSQANDKVQA